MSNPNDRPRLPPVFAERRHGRREPGVRQLDGRPVSWERLFAPPDPGGMRFVHEAGEPLQHRVGFRTVREDGKTRTESLIPAELASDPLSNRLDAFLDLADHAELVARWSMGFVKHRVMSDPRFQAELVLAYLWGTPAERGWSLAHRADLELQVRLPPLAGMTTRRDLERTLAAVFEQEAVLHEDRGLHDAGRGEMAASLDPTPESSAQGRVPAHPPIIGPAPLAPPLVRVELSGEAHQIAEDLGFAGKADLVSSVGPGGALAMEIVGSYSPLHAVTRVETTLESEIDGSRWGLGKQEN
ncbi:MAG TPA: hypothetical protein RMG48_12235 [Myxococcales bacterium LLY-WYZ-16_1]|nr:hypothetical protein [Myxococcales bacterium LLY-WYZ-16_1]